MVLHFRQMEFGRLELSGRESSAGLDLRSAGVIPTGDLEYHLEAGLSGGGVWICGSLRLPVELECVHCLETFAHVVEVTDFALQLEMEETGGGESLDLTEWIREDILLALPTYPKCDTDGGKTCSVRFPTVVFAPVESESPQVSSAWSALDALESTESPSPNQSN